MENTILTCGELSLDTVFSRTTSAKGKAVLLTGKETAIVEYLLLYKERVIKVEEMMEHVWDSDADSFSNSVRVHLSSLRRKLRAELSYDPIENIIGEGYVIREAQR